MRGLTDFELDAVYGAKGGSKGHGGGSKGHGGGDGGGGSGGGTNIYITFKDIGSHNGNGNGNYNGNTQYISSHG